LNFRFFHTILLSITACVLFSNLQAQLPDSAKAYRNIIRLNLSNPVLFGIKNNIIGYERIFKENESFSVNMGRFSIPKFESFSEDTIQLQNNYKDKGFNFSIDYRLYLMKENKYNAPHGIYIGPYYAYNYFERENNWTLNTDSYQGELISDLNLNMHLIGFELGCQFVLWKRLTLDVIFMGPGLWFFNLKTRKNTSLDPDDAALFYDELNEQLKEKFPGYNYVIDGSEIKRKGSFRSGRFGYRYLVNLGFRF
jgi:hypothetical protein